MNPVLQNIADRRSIRAYEEKAIEKETLDALINAAFCAPSAKNLQPWHLSVVQDLNLIEELNVDGLAALVAYGQPSRHVHLFHRAPCIITIANDTNNDWSVIDSGIMAQTIALAAKSLGLGSCMIGLIRTLFNPEHNPNYKQAEEKFYAKLGVPEGYRIGLAITLGYAAQDPEARVKAHKVSYV